MKKNKIISIFLIALSIMSIEITMYAHSGKTDSSGGHKDNKNKSGLGSYHYHCGGYPAHLHTNGVCPYSSNSSKKSSTSTTSASTKSTSTLSTTIAVTSIQINENIENLEVGENKIITAKITPSNATDKNVIWKSSDENIATISASGEIIAKKAGIVNMTATSSNGKTATIKINIKEKEKLEKDTIVNTPIDSSNNNANNTMTSNQENSNPLGGILALGLFGSGGYLGYKKYKKSRK